jgi:ribulose-phosphate 3-epimerase
MSPLSSLNAKLRVYMRAELKKLQNDLGDNGYLRDVWSGRGDGHGYDLHLRCKDQESHILNYADFQSSPAFIYHKRIKGYYQPLVQNQTGLRYDNLLIPPPKIVPSILSADFRKLGEEVREAERAGVDMLHFDIMDGHFVPNISFGPMMIKALRSESSLPFITHLMVERPEEFTEPVINAGGNIVIFHIEACRHPLRLIDFLRKRRVGVGVALNPMTPLSAIRYVVKYADMILLMTVEPGFGGQEFIPEMMDKIRGLRGLVIKQGLRKDIAVDGGVDFTNVPSIVHAGANVLIAGTSVFGQNVVEEAVKKLKKIALEAYNELVEQGLGSLREKS